MLYETYQKGNYQIIKINEALTLNTDITKLEDVVNKFLKKNITNIAIHFKDGSYLYSNTAAVIIYCWKTVKFHNGYFVLINVNENIYTYLALLAFDLEIKIYDSEEELEVAIS